ncbi:MAG: hypothetical protein AAGH65_06535 [Pseudomonadota bacterium]
MDHYQYNLVLMHVPNYQHVGDFMTIRNMLIGVAPEIRTIIASYVNDAIQLPPNALDTINSLPTLIFSPAPLDLPPQFRGTRLVPKKTTKLEEYALLQQHDLPFPASRPIQSLDDLDHLDLGERFVIKPNVGKQGERIILVTAAACKDIVREQFGEHNLDLIAQQPINTGPQPTGYRAFTVLGEVIYLAKFQSLTLEVEQTLAELHYAPIAANLKEGRYMELVKDQDIIELAQQVHRAVPSLPVLGQDIVRDVDSGELFILELNAGGWTWHLSSNYGSQFRKTFKLDYYGQFNALDTITKALARVTTEHAA